MLAGEIRSAAAFLGAVDELAAIVLLINGTVGDERVNLAFEA